jgi:DEAD/DEAH box helicase domain-containing protein
MPLELHPDLVDALSNQGIAALWDHQAECWNVSRRSRHFIVTTGTASGKSLCFNLPVLDELLREPRARALYLYPTKALAQDQLRRIRALAGSKIEVFSYDGDTPAAARKLARQKARILLTNPDMINVSILPRHERWDDFLDNLKYVVIDEAHTYRGVFGSNVANVLRRLRRVASFYGSRPKFILASATISNARQHAMNLTGLKIAHVDNDTAPSGPRQIVFWQPPMAHDELNIRRSASSEAASLLTELIRKGIRSICFTKSRRAAELVYQQCVGILKQSDPRLCDRLSPYRAGYTPEQRRAIEAKLFNGQLLAVVSTSALELGIDIGALDASITLGYPGTVASLWQQWGRAGRGKNDSLGVFIAGNDALEQFFVHHPDELLQRDVEAATIDFANPYIHTQHLSAAAYEMPLSTSDRQFFGRDLPASLDKAVEEGLLRHGQNTWYFNGAGFPAAKIGLRSTAGRQYDIVEKDTGVIIGTEGAETAFSTLHPGAVYLHMGDTYLVESLEIDAHIALVRQFWDSYHTLPRRETDTRIIADRLQAVCGPLTLHFGEIAVSNKVVAFQKRQTGSDEVLGTEELDLPMQQFVTDSFWFTVPVELIGEEQIARLPGAIHAIEHGLIALLPLFAMCDRWDIGGLSTPVHAQTEQPTIFVYDGHPGGVGICRQGYERFADLLRDTGRLIRDCPCEHGCPSCIQSPKCGNWNEPLDKQLALQLIDAMLS